MTTEIDDLLARARTELEVANTLAVKFAAQSVGHCYDAAFFAAEAALLALGESRSKHSGVLSAFGQVIVKQGGFDQETGRLLRQLFERRNEATYGTEQVDPDLANRAVADARRFFEAVEVWLAGRPR